MFYYDITLTSDNENVANVIECS